jgi:hypothetical protein
MSWATVAMKISPINFRSQIFGFLESATYWKIVTIYLVSLEAMRAWRHIRPISSNMIRMSKSSPSPLLG